MQHRTHRRIILFASLWLSAVCALFGFTVAFARAAPALAAEATPTPAPERALPTLDIPLKTQLPMQLSQNGRAPFLNTENVALPDDLLQAVLNTLSDELNAEPTKTAKAIAGTQFALASARLEENWVLLSLGSVDGPASVPGYVGNGEAGVLLIGQRVNDAWLLGIEGTPAFATLLAAAPDEFVSPDAKTLILQTPNSNSNSLQSVSYKWPWPATSKFYWWQGWHSRSALDMGTMRTDRRVLASAGGVVRFMCKGRLGAAIKIKDADGVTLEYWHIDTKLLDADVKEGALLGQGQILGSLRPGTWVDPTCGNQFTQQSASNSHLHWELPKDRPITIDGWTIRQPKSVFTNGLQSRTCIGACFRSYVSFDSSNVAFSGRPQLWSTPELGLVSQGELITVAIGISNAHHLGPLRIGLSYSPTNLSVQAITIDDGPQIFKSVVTPSMGTASLTFSATNYTGTLAYVGLRAQSVGTATLKVEATPLNSTTHISHVASLSIVPGCAGDYDRDSDVDLLDVQRVAYRWDSRKGDVAFDAFVDTDSDGQINQADVQRVANRLGALCVAVPRARMAENAAPSAAAQWAALSDTLQAGDVFTVGLVVSDVASLGAFDASFSYSATQFEVMAVSTTDFLANTGRSMALVDWVTHTVSVSDVTHSAVLFGAYSLGAWPAGPSGAGVLAEITLRALSQGESRLRLTKLQLSDVEGKPQPASLPVLTLRVIEAASEVTAHASPRIYLPLLTTESASQGD